MAQPWSSSKVLLKVGITGVLGGGSYALTNLFESSEVAKITLSVLVAGSALIVQFMMDFESGTRRLEQKFDDHAQAVEERVKEGFARFGEITGFLGRLDTDTGRAEEVERLVRNVAALDPARARIFQAFADAEISRVAGLLGDLGGRYVDYEGEDREWLLTLARCANSTIDAASTHEDLAFWNTDLGRRYLEAQREAVDRRQVTIRRLIIVDTPEQITREIENLRVRQVRANIDVKIAAFSELPEELKIFPVNNFVVFDGAISYEVSPDFSTARGQTNEPVNPMIASTKLVLRTTDVDKRIERFDALWAEGN
ncbi:MULTISPECIES: hypothetical protein [Streptomyces]|uniref:Uncharacterized protein n=1 Tax=Streptomyces sp. NBC_00093 TaxID=2975649 RepID=A0AAU1ZTD7_9ACTN